MWSGRKFFAAFVHDEDQRSTSFSVSLLWLDAAAAISPHGSAFSSSDYNRYHTFTGTCFGFLACTLVLDACGGSSPSTGWSSYFWLERWLDVAGLHKTTFGFQSWHLAEQQIIMERLFYSLPCQWRSVLIRVTLYRQSAEAFVAFCWWNGEFSPRGCNTVTRSSVQGYKRSSLHYFTLGCAH